MKGKTKNIYLFILLEITFLLLPVFPVNAARSSENRTRYILSENTPRVFEIDWQYKFFNGVMYRRLYNYTTNTPLTDWEIAP